MSRKKRWYDAGLRFECTGCGACCTGEPGFVYVNDAEIAALAERCGMPVAEFEANFVRPIGHGKSLVERPNGDCVFFDPVTKGCRVYDLRPRQCRTWPFWNSNLVDESAWEDTCRGCPGCGRGPLHDAAEIDRLRNIIDV